jgi:hypothetical protein
MKFLKLYSLLLGKSLAIRSRASRMDVVIFHTIGLIPIVFCRGIAPPIINDNILKGVKLLIESVIGMVNISAVQPASSPRSRKKFDKHRTKP